jgi:hypothetical protein
MIPIPKVTLQDGKLVGWDMFERWAVNNLVAWNHMDACIQRGDCTREQAIQFLAYYGAVRAHELSDRLIEEQTKHGW